MGNRTMAKKPGILKYVLLFMTLPLLLAESASAQLLPFTQYDLNQVNKSENFRDSQIGTVLQCGESSLNPSDNSSVFFIGDSITVGMTDSGLLEKAKEKGFVVNTTFEKLPARYVSGTPRRKGPSIEAIGAYQSSNIQPYLAEHATDYANAGTIVVALGTNRGVSTPQETMINYTTQFVDVLRSNNPAARIVWVNVYREDGREDNINAALAEAGARKNFTVLDFSSVARADPEKYKLSDSVHHTTSGNQAKADWILDQISNTNSANVANTKITAPSPSLNFPLGKVETVEGLTEDQRIAQTFILGFSGAQANDMKAIVEKYKIGGVFILGNDNGVYNKAFFDALNTSAGIPLLVTSDEEGGRVQRFREQIGEFPSAKELGALSDAEVELTAKTIGEKLLERGVNTVLGPVADLSVEGSGAVFDLDRGFSADPAVVAAKANAFAKGLRSAGVNPTFKHFPGLGTTPGNTDNEPQTSPDIDTLRGRDLLAFESIIQRHDPLVMLNNAQVPGLTEEGKVVGTSPAGVSLLRDELGFQGVITTDDLKAGALADENPKDTVAEALQAGVTMPLFNYINEAELQEIISEIRARNIDVRPNLFEIIEYKNKNLEFGSNLNACAVNTTGDNEADVFRILVDEYGFTREQAAGVIANMRHESSVEPMRLQGTPQGFETPSSTVDIGSTRGIGWGLVQWTPTAKIIEQSFIRDIPYEQIDTIPFQLEFLVGQLRGEGIGGDVSSEKSRAGNPFFASTTVEEAASIFAVDYERCAACQEGSSEVQDRINEAVEILTNLGSN
jgi:beta-N-acetylhexosaminidase